MPKLNFTNRPRMDYNGDTGRFEVRVNGNIVFKSKSYIRALYKLEKFRGLEVEE